MAPVFVFAEQIQHIVRSGEKEIEIPEGAQISAAAADLIKEHQIRVKTVAPGGRSDKKAAETVTKPAVSPKRSEDKASGAAPVEKSSAYEPPGKPPEIEEDQLEDIVTRVLERFKAVKTGHASPDKPAGGPGNEHQKAGDDDLIICRCEEITKGEIKDAVRNGMVTLNGVKRITRAGMGLCQGQTCQQLVARILAEEIGVSASEIDPTTARGPVRPLRLAVFANR